MARYIVQRLLIALLTVVAVALVTNKMIPVPSHTYPYVPTVRWDDTRGYDPCGGRGSSFIPTRMLAVAVGGEAPGRDPSCSRIGEREQSFHDRVIERIRVEFEWVSIALRGDLGRSLHSGEAVNDQIARRLPASAQLALMAMAVAVFTAVPLGVLAAVWRGLPEYVARLTSLAGLAVPEFLLATLVLFVLSYWLGWLPDLAYPSLLENPTASLASFFFPALIVGWRIGAISTRMTRPAVLDVLQQDYVRTARAKGLSERSVVIHHALRNALLPVLTIIGNQFPSLLAGLVVIEIVFGIPGMGTLGFHALQSDDHLLAKGVLFVTAVTVIGANLVVDLACAALDPRIRYT